MTDQAPINFVVVGGGRMGQTHIQAGKECGFNLVGVCDIREEALKDIQDTFCIEKNITFTKYNDLFEKNNFDLAIVATTAPSHHEIVMALTKTNAKYILCEKPLSNSFSAAIEMIDNCAKNNLIFAVNHQMRYMDQYKLIKRAPADYNTGKLKSMIISGANIGLAMNGTHYFEAFRWITGNPITKVWSWLDSTNTPNPRGKDFFDQSGQIFAKTEKGERLFLEIGSDLGHQIIVTYNFEFGKIVVNELNGEVNISTRKSEIVPSPSSRYGMPNDQIGFDIQMANSLLPTVSLLLELIKFGDFPTGLDALHALKVAFAAIESSKNGNSEIDLSKLDKKLTPQKWA